MISGDRSHPSLRQVAYRLAAALADARYVELEGCGQTTYAEQLDDSSKTFEVSLADSPSGR